MDLILPDLNANSFKTASGKEYIIYPTVGTGRFPMLEICMIEIQHGLSVSGFKSEILEAYELQNKSKFADVSVKLHNLQNGVSRILSGQMHPIFKLCTLFVCSPSENRETWSEAEAQEKVADWSSVDDAFFLNCARLFVRRYFKDLGIDFLSTSTQIRSDPDGEGSAR